LIDVIIPRGGKGLIERVCNETNISVIKHLDGICHVYVDKEVDLDMAISVAFNSKAEKYGVCNAMETLLVHRDVAQPILSELSRRFEEKGVELRCCPSAKTLCPSSRSAEEVDWSTEYLGPILSIKVVENLNEAIDHINNYGSHHTDVICTSSYESSRKFVRSVDSASVMVNSSSQFADGFEYGLGAEIGISTDKLHARGPVGLEGLTSEKYVVFGDGEVRRR
jgi:glutamate-5-semialdehyde dehydrogenase